MASVNSKIFGYLDTLTKIVWQIHENYKKKIVCYITNSELLVLDGLDEIGGADNGFDSFDILCFLC